VWRSLDWIADTEKVLFDLTAHENLQAALKEVKPTTLEWLTTARNYARYSNESGQYDDVLAFLKAHGRG